MNVQTSFLRLATYSARAIALTFDRHTRPGRRYLSPEGKDPHALESSTVRLRIRTAPLHGTTTCHPLSGHGETDRGLVLDTAKHAALQAVAVYLTLIMLEVRAARALTSSLRVVGPSLGSATRQSKCLRRGLQSASGSRNPSDVAFAFECVVYRRDKVTVFTLLTQRQH